jgi:hypothetical protein
MKNLKLALALAGLAIMISCSTVKVTTDSNKTTDFTRYTTYSFLGWQDDTGFLMNEFDKKRMRDAFQNEFSKRNLKYVEEGGEMTVALFLVVDEKTSTTAYTNYYGGSYGRYSRYGYGWGHGYATTTFSEDDYLLGTIVMDVFDENSGEQIWQGVAKGTINENPEKREKSIPKAIESLMKDFPVAIQPVE